MKKILYIPFLFLIIFIITGFYDSNGNIGNINPIIIKQITFDPNYTRTKLTNTGMFDQDLIQINHPGFEWPVSSGKYAIFTAGLTIAAMVNNNLRMAACSYRGEYVPGRCQNGVLLTDTTFRFYKVKNGDNNSSSYDWQNWGRMVPYGAPYVDVNHNGSYEPAIDSPGVKSASQTIFICLTDADPTNHQTGEGFGGGTAPLFAEVHMTAWGYNNSGILQDMQFFKFAAINKSTSPWNSTYLAIVSDPDLGYSDDDYIGCDTVRKMGFCYNGDNDDAGNSYSYGFNPPAVGFVWLNCGQNYGLKSVNYFTSTSIIGPVCEKDPNGVASEAYKLIKALKKDGTPWVIPLTNPPQITKYCYSGDPETGEGWNEGAPGNPTGSVWNCGGILTGEYHPINNVGDRRIIMGSGADNFIMNPGDTQNIMIAQIIARGTNNLNSVTLLKQRADFAQQFCSSGFIIGINPISTDIPKSFSLYQNYPNPFNPTTKIKFDIPALAVTQIINLWITRLTIYNLLGQEVTTLINESLKPGTYEISWDASNYPSGVYYYKLKTGEFELTKKMVLLK